MVSFPLKPLAVLQEGGNSLGNSTHKRGFILLVVQIFWNLLYKECGLTLSKLITLYTNALNVIPCYSSSWEDAHEEKFYKHSLLLFNKSLFEVLSTSRILEEMFSRVCSCNILWFNTYLLRAYTLLGATHCDGHTKINTPDMISIMGSARQKRV